jgi:hypothetical protein
LPFDVDLFERASLGIFKDADSLRSLEPDRAGEALISVFLFDKVRGAIIAQELDAFRVALKAQFLSQESNINVRTVTVCVSNSISEREGWKWGWREVEGAHALQMHARAAMRSRATNESIKYPPILGASRYSLKNLW